MTHRALLLAAALGALGVVVPLRALGPAPAESEKERELPLAQMVGSLEMEGRSSPLAVMLMRRGPLFSVRQVVERLGGELHVGPFQQGHELKLGDTSFLFGPESAAVTFGGEIVSLSQPPQLGPGGLAVPLDLLEAVYTELDGKRFAWREREGRLVVDSGSLRVLPVAVDVVHLQGVSTVVLQFPARPRYRIVDGPGRVTVHVLGDRIQPPARVARAREGLIRDVRFGPQDVTILLAPGAGTESYELADPYRLVFDVFPGGAVAPAGGTPALPPPRRDRIPTIVIDPGHGGSDEGAKGGALVEKDLTLRLARLLRGKLLEALPVRVVLTRDEDADLPLDTRAALANQLKAELFVSLHLNSSFGSRATGAETYFLSLDASDERAELAALDANRAGGDPLTDLELILWDMAQSRHLNASQRLASLIQGELNETLGLRDRGVKQAPFRVLMGAAMPAVLVELGFLSNPAEVDRLEDPLYQNELMDALTRALVRYRAATWVPAGASASATEVPE
ncbi:MAG: N-acetylmuramoyl-L-alanine amidase [Acidobacteriota bacterium]|nr:N-acetylmuramoyl-L-alanine amidase [Acidobacteriota bacterium]